MATSKFNENMKKDKIKIEWHSIAVMKELKNEIKGENYWGPSSFFDKKYVFGNKQLDGGFIKSFFLTEVEKKARYMAPTLLEIL
jgi:hypothetical protein